MGLIDNKDVTLYVKSDDGSFIELGYIPKLPINVVGVIFCKDCKYGSIDVYDNSNVMPIWCEYCDDYRNETDFCSRGEKRDG